MNGTVNESLEALLPVMLLDREGQPFEVDVVIDTGATNWLALPVEIIDELQLPQLDYEQVTFVDGQVIDYKTYACQMLWLGRVLTVQAIELNADPLLGMRLLEGCRLTIDVRAGGAVRVSDDKPAP